jgi:hypothetical protein
MNMIKWLQTTKTIMMQLAIVRGKLGYTQRFEGKREECNSEKLAI